MPALPRPARPCLVLPRPGRVFTLKPNGGTWGVLRLRTELLAVLPACCCGCSVPAELGGSHRGQGWSLGATRGRCWCMGVAPARLFQLWGSCGVSSQEGLGAALLRVSSSPICLLRWCPCCFCLLAPQILEDYLLVEDVPLLEEMAEEDEELDLYNEMTFGLGKVKGSPRLGLTSQHLVG